MPTILVVDDDILVHDLIGRSLSKEGYRVLFARNGEEGIQLARTQLPQAITLDALMPEIDGWEVLTALKADPATAAIPVIMLTIVDDRNLAYSLGASDFLTKPIDRDRLVTAIARHSKAAAYGKNTTG